jgi:hypothetical protein
MHSHTLSDADRSLRDAFDTFAVPPEEFTHEAHVPLAYAYLAELDVEPAVQRMREALLKFLEHNDIPLSKFHETITRAWVLAVRHFMNKSSSSSASDFIAMNPELLASKIMLTHYSASVLCSADARAGSLSPPLIRFPTPIRD